METRSKDFLVTWDVEDVMIASGAFPVKYGWRKRLTLAPDGNLAFPEIGVDTTGSVGVNYERG